MRPELSPDINERQYDVSYDIPAEYETRIEPDPSLHPWIADALKTISINHEVDDSPNSEFNKIIREINGRAEMVTIYRAEALEEATSSYYGGNDDGYQQAA